MFGNDAKDLACALSEMERIDRDRCHGNQVEAKQVMAGWVAADRRFDGYDPQRLIDRVCLPRPTERNWMCSIPSFSKVASLDRETAVGDHPRQCTNKHANARPTTGETRPTPGDPEERKWQQRSLRKCRLA
jgi:hypothetical protein